MNTSRSNDWVSRRFYLCNKSSAPRLFCCNTADGFTFGEINFDNDELFCDFVDSCQSGLQINHLCWFPQTTHRPSRKHLKIGFISIPSSIEDKHITATYTNDLDTSNHRLKYFDETNHLIPSSIDYNEKFDQLGISHLNGTVKIYSSSNNQITYQSTFTHQGTLHRLEWNPLESDQLLLAHQNRLNIFDSQREQISSTFNHSGKEHLADCTWKNSDILLGRHRHEILMWDKRVSREPIRNEVLDPFGQIEKLKCSLASPQHLLSIYDSRLEKIKIFDFRFLTMRQVESFDQIKSSFLDYYWTIEKMSIVVSTHQGLLHWIDVDVPIKSKFVKKKF